MYLPESRYGFSAERTRNRRRIILLILVASALCVGGGVTAYFVSSSPGQRIVEDTAGPVSVYDLWEDQEYGKVVAYSNRVLYEEPMNAEALMFHGFARFYQALGEFSMEDRLGFIDESIVSLRKARIPDNHPFPAKVEYVLGKAYYHKGRYYMDQAAHFLESALKNGVEADDIYEYLGLTYGQLEQYEKSAEYFEIAVERNSSDLLYLTLSQTYYKLARIPKAEEYLIRTINRTEDVSIEEKSRFLLGQIYIDKEDYLKAENQYKMILEKDPRSADAHFQLGEIYVELGDSIRARSEWRKALQIDPSHYGARLRYYN